MGDKAKAQGSSRAWRLGLFRFVALMPPDRHG